MTTAKKSEDKSVDGEGLVQDKNTHQVYEDNEGGPGRSPDSYVENIPVRSQVVENDGRAGALRFTFEVSLDPYAPGAATDEQVVELARASVAKHFPTNNFDWERIDSFENEEDDPSKVLVPNHQDEFDDATGRFDEDDEDRQELDKPNSGVDSSALKADTAKNAKEDKKDKKDDKAVKPLTADQIPSKK